MAELCEELAGEPGFRHPTPQDHMERAYQRRFEDTDICLAPGQLMPGTFYAAQQSLELLVLGVLIGNQQYSHCTAPRNNNMNIVIGSNAENLQRKVRSCMKISAP
jgi:hypothetical protein